MSLPHLFGTTLETVPTTTPYLHGPAGVDADPRIKEASGLKIGLAWAGSPTRRDNHKRSVALEKLAPLIDLPNTSFFSLQVGPFAEELGASPLKDRIVDLAPELGDFADTAACLEALDVLVSVDTGVLHLAGALGKPCLALMSQPTGFLWMNERADSPWYPNTRLIRQTTPGDWAPVIAEARMALADMIVGVD